MTRCMTADVGSYSMRLPRTFLPQQHLCQGRPCPRSEKSTVFAQLLVAVLHNNLSNMTHIAAGGVGRPLMAVVIALRA
jgi:hypothetical protein